MALKFFLGVNPINVPVSTGLFTLVGAVSLSGESLILYSQTLLIQALLIIDSSLLHVSSPLPALSPPVSQGSRTTTGCDHMGIILNGQF